MIRELFGMLWMAGALIGIPVIIGRYAMQASWLDIGKAYIVLAVICLICGASAGETWDKRLMWTLILGMIAVIPGVPFILLLMRLFGQR